MTDSYDKLDRFLRNNLDDSDYEEYSEALEELYSPSAMFQIQIESLRQQVKELETEAANTNHTMNEYRMEIVALKSSQGKPFGWYWDYPNEDGFIVNDGRPYDVPPEWIPLYTSAPTTPEVELKLRYLIDIAYDHLLACGYKEEDPTLTQLRDGLSAAPEYKGDSECF